MPLKATAQPAVNAMACLASSAVNPPSGMPQGTTSMPTCAGPDCSSAVAEAKMAGTFSVPERHPRSCPPPDMTVFVVSIRPWRA